jgi:hypothetical protein
MFLECRKFEGDDYKRIEHINHSDLNMWLKSHVPDGHPVAGLRLVVGRQNPSHPHSPFGKDQLSAFTEDSQLSSLLESLLDSAKCPMTRLKSEVSDPGELL